MNHFSRQPVESQREVAHENTEENVVANSSPVADAVGEEIPSGNGSLPARAEHISGKGEADACRHPPGADA